MTATIKAIDGASVHKITSGQVVVDLQTAVKELVENSLDAGATNIEIRFKHYGLRSIEVADNGSGIPEGDHANIALKHCTSKLASYEDLAEVTTFGFRGEALSSLCALSESVTVTTCTKAPMGVKLEMAPDGQVKNTTKTARQKGTSVTLLNLFSPLPVRRKEFERNLKREFGKAMSLLTSYALVPCAGQHGQHPPVRLLASNLLDSGSKSVQLRTNGSSTPRVAAVALWGNKALDNVVDLDIAFDVEKDKHALKRLTTLTGDENLARPSSVRVSVKGLISKFSPNHGRSGTDRQFFYINGRPCNLTKIQKTFNEVYRSFNATQSPFIIADFIVPPDTYDVNVSPDKRTIFVHNEANLLSALRASLEETFSPSRSTFDLHGSQPRTQNPLPSTPLRMSSASNSPPIEEEDELESSSVGPSESEARSNSPMQIDDRDTISITAPPSSPHAPSELPNQTQSTPLFLDANSDSEDPDDSVSVVLDTTRAAWTQPSKPRDRHREVPEDEHEPPRKKRRSEGVQRKIVDMFKPSSLQNASQDDANTSGEEMDVDEPPPTRTLRAKSQVYEKTSVKSPQRLASQLKIFAMPGSQVPLEEEADDDQIDEEVIHQVDSPDDTNEVPSDHRSDDEASIRSATPTLPLVTSKTPIPELVDLTGDDLFEDDIPTIPAPGSSLTSSVASAPIPRPEVIKSMDNETDITLRFDITHITSVWANLRRDFVNSFEDILSPPSHDLPMDVPGISSTQDEAKATQTLTRVIEKSDFARMDILGQFNLGFIIVRRQKRSVDDDNNPGGALMDDLFIVDQHAADEKYNFEQLQQTTKIKSQSLLKPIDLELTAADELTAVENMHILQSNGFDVLVSPESYDGDDMTSRKRLQLLAQPTWRNSYTFCMSDRVARCFVGFRIVLRAFKEPFPPGPAGRPILGHFNIIPWSGLPTTISEWAKKYSSDILYLHCFSQPYIFLNSKDTISDLLDKRSAIYSDRPVTVSYKLIGWDPDVVFLPYGPQLRKQRKALAFSPQACSAFQQAQIQNVHILAKELLENKSNVADLFSRYTTAVALRVAYGHQVVSADDDYLGLINEAITVTHVCGMPASTFLDYFPVFRFFPSWFPGTHYANVARAGRPAVRRLIEVPYNWVTEKLANGDTTPSFIASQIDALGHPPTAEDREDIRTAAAVIHSAGAETTTSNLIKFILVLLLLPEVQTAGQEEVDKVVGNDRLPTFEDRASMPYTDLVLQELLRWHPVTPVGVPHRTRQEDTYKGMHIPKGAFIFPNVESMAMDESVYTDPTKFNPTRYLAISGGGNGEPFFEPAFGFGRR
ncbi:hypothetical protein ONZ45_g15042 [Pleurotus djamor]|nr:hypothetical protein ONZ45_g15042 [Pleurotus djamor]